MVPAPHPSPATPDPADSRARLLTAAGQPPLVLSGAAVVGETRATDLFERAYDEHAHRLARLYATVGKHNP